jgi:hypothetical protein
MNKKGIACMALTGIMAFSAAALSACGNESSAPKYADETIDRLFKLNSGSRTDEGNGINSTHDPVVVEAKRNGKSEFYAFSTDNDQYGVQIRKSLNLYRWERAGVAINGFTAATKAQDVQNMYKNGNAELQPVYQVLTGMSDWNNSCWTLWAPDVVPATSNKNADADGEWWLYSCWTSKFGSEQSVIFKCKSTEGVTGPYKYEGIIVQDSADDRNLNEIDPSVFYAPDGKMYLSYGSYYSGFGVIELDPATGLRKEGTPSTPGKQILTGNGFNAEGSAINYHTVDVYTGDIANEEYDASKWQKQSKYYMMGSWGALAYNYNMRVWTSDTPDGTYTSERGGSGLQVSGTWTWRKDGEGVKDGTTNYPNKDKDMNFYIPGHNDMITTSDGVNAIIYHARVAEARKDGNPSFAEGEHYLYTSMYDFNSKGQLVINPNRYVGEKIGTVNKKDLLSKTNGNYSAVLMESHDNLSYTEKAEIAHAQDCKLNEDGTVTLGEKSGTWKVYGDHYIFIRLDGRDYYGSVMPAQIRQYDATLGYKTNNGLTISAIAAPSEKNPENGILYLNMQF